MDPVPPTARFSLYAGIAALVLALGGALVTQVMDPGTTVRILGILVWVVGVLAVLGLGLGLLSGLKGPGRSGAVVSVAALLLLGLFLGYSAYGTTSSGAPTAVGTNG